MEKNKSHRCNEPGCTKAFWFKAALNRHLKTHRENDPDFPKVDCCCCECPKVFTKVESLRRHYKVAHGNLVLYPCEYEGCNQMFQRKDNLQRHTASHEENKNHCDICGKGFARKDAMLRHKLTHIRKAEKANKSSEDYQASSKIESL